MLFTFRVEWNEITAAGRVRRALVDCAALVDARLTGLGFRSSDQQPEIKLIIYLLKLLIVGLWSKSA